MIMLLFVFIVLSNKTLLYMTYIKMKTLLFDTSKKSPERALEIKRLLD